MNSPTKWASILHVLDTHDSIRQRWAAVSPEAVHKIREEHLKKRLAQSLAQINASTENSIDPVIEDLVRVFVAVLILLIPISIVFLLTR